MSKIWIPPETEGSSTVWSSDRDPDVYNILYSGLVQDDSIMRERDGEIPVTFTWNNQKQTMIVLINVEKQYLVTNQNTSWRISPEFARSIAAGDYGLSAQEEG